jgi:putative tryptophan/tyrosine transport system substrate-binding protein
MLTSRLSSAILMVILGLLAAPPPAGAQSAGKMARIGWLGVGLPPSEADLQRSPFRQALRELGWVEGKNVAFESRFAEGDLDRLPAYAAELVHLGVDLIVATGGIAIRAAQDATSTIPIVMAGTGDPVQAGFVASLAAPGGNITGVSNLRSDLNGKRLELLKEAVPGASRVAVLADPATPYTPGIVQETERTAQGLGVQLHILEVSEPSRLEPVFAALTNARVDALIVLPASRFGAHRRQIVDLVAHRKLPAIYDARSFVQAGGLMSYSENITERLQRVARYVDKILKGAKPADLPIEQPTTFELVINLKTAKALGLTIPPSLLFQATEVIR